MVSGGPPQTRCPQPATSVAGCPDELLARQCLSRSVRILLPTDWPLLSIAKATFRCLYSMSKAVTVVRAGQMLAPTEWAYAPERMLEAFQALVTKRRETHVRQFEYVGAPVSLLGGISMLQANCLYTPRPTRLTRNRCVVTT